jgi:hypothetical protein
VSPDYGARLRAYGEFLAAISAERVDELRTLAAPDVRFRDPFNDVQGIEPMLRVFYKMFEDARDIRFDVLHSASAGPVGYLRWEMSLRPTSRLMSGQTLRFSGVSEVRFDEQGRVALHVDHWDAGAQFYERLPLLGGLLRLIRRPLAVRD